MSRSSIPVDAARDHARANSAERQSVTLEDMMADGFHMLFMIRSGQDVMDGAAFAASVRRYLSDFERKALRESKSAREIEAVRYAFCATIDELVLNSRLHFRDDWALRPLQLELFGDQLAGEHFFDRLEALRAEGAGRVEALEVFHLCLLLGFHGKYALEGREKLGYLTARLGDEIATYRGRSRELAPHWQAPDRISNVIRQDLPLWVVAAVCGLFALLTFMGIEAYLSHQTAEVMAQADDLIKAPPDTAHLTITLP